MVPTVDFQFGTCIDIRPGGFHACRQVQVIRKGVSRWDRHQAVAMIVQRARGAAWELHLGATHPNEVGPAEAADHTERTLRDHYGPVSEVL